MLKRVIGPAGVGRLCSLDRMFDSDDLPGIQRGGTIAIESPELVTLEVF